MKLDIPQIERDIFTDAYKFYVVHRDVKTEPDWQAAANDMTALAKKYNNHPLCAELLIGICTGIDRMNEATP